MIDFLASLLACPLKRTILPLLYCVGALLLSLRHEPLRAGRTTFSALYLRRASQKQVLGDSCCRNAGDAHRSERLYTDRAELKDVIKPSDTKPLLHVATHSLYP